MRPWSRWTGLALAALAVAACEGASAPPLPGKRISVLTLERTLEPDPSIARDAVRLPKPFANPDWPQAAGYPNHAMHHLAAPGNLALLWRRAAGTGSASERRLLASPVVAGGRIYVLDSRVQVSAIDAENGRAYWHRPLAPKEEDDEAGYGGGVAVVGEVLYATTGFGEVWAIAAGNGAVLWRNKIGVPFRAAPTVVGDRVFAVSLDNQTHALSTEDGRVLWTHTGVAEDAGLLGISAPAFDAGLVVVPYSSGEVFALRAENGRVAWSDSLLPQGKSNQAESLASITGKPVIDRGRVIAISHGGQMASYDLRTGAQIWDQQLGGSQTPWVAGDYVYVITNDGEVVCLRRSDGRLRWATPLARWLDDKKKSLPIVWYGPLLAGDRLLAVSSRGVALSISPYTGEVLGQVILPDGIAVPPILANGTMYLVTRDAEVLAYR
ncbi:MAG: pyrrolo-quinoline quinone [Alphaproteobacteria bacterium]|nr:pyrrolo-quinoline quinone [Alphaproteobacteria bacterium]